MSNNIIIFPINKKIKEKTNIVNKEIIDKQYKQLIKQQEEIKKPREEICQT